MGGVEVAQQGRLATAEGRLGRTSSWTQMTISRAWARSTLAPRTSISRKSRIAERCGRTAATDPTGVAASPLPREPRVVVLGLRREPKQRIGDLTACVRIQTAVQPQHLGTVRDAVPVSDRAGEDVLHQRGPGRTGRPATEPLDLGRNSRLFSAAQRKALAVGHPHCRAEGCTVPAAWCEAHHLDTPWARGGRTACLELVEMTSPTASCSATGTQTRPRPPDTRPPDSSTATSASTAAHRVRVTDGCWVMVGSATVVRRPRGGSA
jgi:hypothetical protein